MKASLDTPAWQVELVQYRALRDALPPAIAEASPYQVANMSKRERAHYDTDREARYQKATNSALAWEDTVVEAFARGDFDESTAGVSKDARDLVRRVREMQDHALVDAAQAQARQLLSLTIDDIEVGGIYYDVIGRGPVRVVKRNRKSVLILGRRDTSVSKRALCLITRFPPHALVGRDYHYHRKLSAAERAQRSHDAMQAWLATVEQMRGAA